MKKLLSLIGLLALFFTLTSSFGCDDKPSKTTSDNKVAVETEKMMNEGNAQVGMPAIKNWQEKKLMKTIYELRDNSKLIRYAYLFNEREGKVGQFLGKCIGYGLPYSTQFSNPEKIVINQQSSTYGSVYGTLPQPEPNGLFMPEGLSATWLLLINPKTGKPEPMYIEPAIIVSAFPLHK